MQVRDRSLGRVWVIFAGMVLVAGVLFAHRFMPALVSDLFFRATQSLHGPGFGLVALVILRLVRSDDGRRAAYFKAGLLALALAVLAEIAQIPGPRTAEVRDIFVDGLGILAFLGLAALFDRQIRDTSGKWRIAILAIVSTAALGLTMAPTLWLSYVLVKRSQAVPLILDFDGEWEKSYDVSAQNNAREIIAAPAGWPADSGSVALLRSAGRFAIILTVFPYPDWSDYNALSFVAATTSDESRFISIGFWGISRGPGIPQDRYYTSVKVGPKPARYRFEFSEFENSSTDRAFDLTHVYQIVLSDSRSELGVKYLVDDFRLEK